jgi:branched-subunit amino acid ABC-type transport system permease component
MIEAWSAFYNSTFQDVIVFSALVPILVVRSLLSPDLAADEPAE